MTRKEKNSITQLITNSFLTPEYKAILNSKIQEGEELNDSQIEEVGNLIEDKIKELSQILNTYF